MTHRGKHRMKRIPRNKLFTPQIKRELISLALKSITMISGPAIYSIIEDLSRSRESIDEKVNKAYESLKETSILVRDLEDDLKERTERLSLLRDEYVRYSELAEIEEGKADVIIRQLELVADKGKNKERLISLLISLVSGVIIFILGIWLGPIVTKLLGI